MRNNKLTEIFSKLNPEHKLFNQLMEKKPAWWENIKKNKSIYVEIRKDNYIDVYYNGGAILHLSYTAGFRGKIHFEYIPLASQDNYIPLRFSDNNHVEIDTSKVDFAKLDNFSINRLSVFQKRIGKFFPSSSEKGIQADFVLKNSAFLDTEFQYKNKNVRFDLVWADVEMRKLYVVELKTIGDSRLDFNEKSRDRKSYDKIDAQLKKYQDFIREQNGNLLSHYERVFTVKKKLGVLPNGLQGLYSLDGFKFEERPILLIGDCTQFWIEKNYKRLNKAVQNVAYGCFYQGKNTRRFSIPTKNTRNRWVFTNCDQ
jgi:hypothetical protein